MSYVFCIAFTVAVEDLNVQLIKCYKGQIDLYINIQDKATSVITILYMPKYEIAIYCMM